MYLHTFPCLSSLHGIWACAKEAIHLSEEKGLPGLRLVFESVLADMLASGLMSAADPAPCVKSGVLKPWSVLWVQVLLPVSTGQLPAACIATTQLSLAVRYISLYLVSPPASVL